jgi:hypothetical protein
MSERKRANSGDGISDRPIRVVLDASAIAAFTHGSINVGEVLGEVADEGGTFALPVLCMTAAEGSTVDHDLLALLAHHTDRVLLGVRANEWQSLAKTVSIVGRLDAASAAIEARRHRCYVLTAQPGLYRGLANGGDVIEV